MIEDTLDHGVYAESPSGEKCSASQLTSLLPIIEMSPLRTEVLDLAPRPARDLAGRIKPGLLI